MTVGAQKIRAAPIRKTLHVKASQARAFEVFTAGIAKWWPPQHTLLKSPLELTIIEHHVGGRWYQIGADKSETDIGRVLTWEPPEKLIVSWQLNSRFEIDQSVESEIEVRFIAESANSTRVEFEQRIFAVDGEAMRAAVDTPGGWHGILDNFVRVAGGDR